jgi:hypothetical protein
MKPQDGPAADTKGADHDHANQNPRRETHSPPLRRHRRRRQSRLEGDCRRLAAPRRQGFSIALDALPINGQIVMREAKPRAARTEAR